MANAMSTAGLFSRNSLEHATAGSIGTVLAMFLLFPFERLKTKLQVDPTAAGLSLLGALERVLQESGVLGLYKGCTPMLQTVGSSNFLYFFLFEGLKDRLAHALGRPEGIVGVYDTLAASALAGSINMVVTEPLWRACVVAQADNKAADSEGAMACTKGAFGTTIAMWQKEGPRALWRGLGTSLWLVSNPVIQFFAYDWMKGFIAGAEITAIEAFVMGAIAKALATFATFPLQVAQSRLRAASGAHGDAVAPELRGMVPCMIHLFRERGFSGMYFGLSAKLLQTVTQAAFMFAFYEKVHAAIRRLNSKKSFMRRFLRYGMKNLAIMAGAQPRAPIRTRS